MKDISRGFRGGWYRDVLRGAACVCELLLRGGREPKVGELELGVLIFRVKQKILRL